VEWSGQKGDNMKEWFERWKSERDGIKEWSDGLKDAKVKGTSIEPTQVRFWLGDIQYTCRAREINSI
jgi:hypothetical protein